MQHCSVLHFMPDAAIINYAYCMSLIYMFRNALCWNYIYNVAYLRLLQALHWSGLLSNVHDVFCFIIRTELHLSDKALFV